jgi:hypothetical protein
VAVVCRLVQKIGTRKHKKEKQYTKQYKNTGNKKETNIKEY